jgi:hypothetical protein
VKVCWAGRQCASAVWIGRCARTLVGVVANDGVRSLGGAVAFGCVLTLSWAVGSDVCVRHAGRKQVSDGVNDDVRAGR